MSITPIDKMAWQKAEGTYNTIEQKTAFFDGYTQAYDDLKAKMHNPVAKREGSEHCPKCFEVPWTEEEWKTEMIRINSTNLERISFMAGVKWAKKRIKERR